MKKQLYMLSDGLFIYFRFASKPAEAFADWACGEVDLMKEDFATTASEARAILLSRGFSKIIATKLDRVWLCL